MRPDRLFLHATALALLLLSGIAPGAEAPDPSILVGQWASTERLPDGRETSSEFTLGADSRFTGSTSVSGKLLWSFGGTWKIRGDELVWNYEQSSTPLVQNAKTDTDEILSANAGVLVLFSPRSGLQHTYFRRN